MSSISSIASFSNSTLKFYTASSNATDNDTIDILVNFSAPVYISGTPQLYLSNGGIATYYGPSTAKTPTTFAYFSYVPTPTSAPDQLLSVTYIDPTNISLAAGGVYNSTLTGVPQTLPKLYIPRIETIQQSGVGSILSVGQSETISIGFDEAINVIGAPKLALNNGGTATYIGGSGSDTLTFQYNVGASDQATSGLNVAGLNLNGGSIRDNAGFDAATLVSGVNQTGPGISSATVNIAAPAVMKGVVSYSIASGSAIISIADIHNLSTISSAGSLSLTLWYLNPSTSYTGGHITGFEVAGYQFPQIIGPGADITPAAITVPISNPPKGTYRVALLLEQAVNGSERVDSYVNFSNLATAAYNDTDLSLGSNFTIVGHFDDGDGTDPGPGNESEGPGNDTNSGSGPASNDVSGSDSNGGAFSVPDTPATAVAAFIGQSELKVGSDGSVGFNTPQIKLLPGAPAAGSYPITVTLELTPLDNPRQQYDLEIQDVGALSGSNASIAASTYSFTSSQIAASAGVIGLPTGDRCTASLSLGDNLGNHYVSEVGFTGSFSIGSAATLFGTATEPTAVPTPSSQVPMPTPQVPTSTPIHVSPAVVPNAVYRFFDSSTGTHFFTADGNERNSILSNRPDLIEETNGFGDVAAGSDGSVAVYRFFDTLHGTHFFTANATEAQTVQATRPDLAYEPQSTFYEHATQHAGDVAVYRLFDMQYGTHFYTGNQAEYSGITTPGSSTFRADLVSEGVSFYAPAGSFS